MVSAVGTFNGQINSNLISMSLLFILLQVKLIKTSFIFMVLGTFTDQID